MFPFSKYCQLELPRYILNDYSLKEIGASQGRIPGQILIMHFSNLTCLIEWRNVLQEHTELFTEYVKGYS